MNPRCSGCGGPHPFDMTVPSPLWNRVIRRAGLPDYLCATCILRAFVNAGEAFTAELWGAEFKGDPIEVRLRSGQPASKDRPWSYKSTLRLSFVDRVKLLLGLATVCVRFRSPDGDLHAACSIDSVVSGETLPAWPDEKTAQEARDR